MSEPLDVARLAWLLLRYDMDSPYDPGKGPPPLTWDQFMAMAHADHEGDCTDMPAPCPRCHADYWLAVARWVAARYQAEGK